MQLTALSDDGAVAPVIAVILMIAVTVVLAAVIATFVLGLGDNVSETGPQTSFTFEWDDANGATQDVLNVTHRSGDTVRAGFLYVRGDRGSGTVSVPSGCDDLGQSFDNYPTDSVGATMSPDSQVTSSDSVKVNCIAPDGEIRIVWEKPEADTSAILGDWSGPTA